jgi:hypothetical protein
MAFHVLVVGGWGWFDYPRLRDVLDSALVKRLPDVQVLTVGGRGVPALAASYSCSRGLSLQTVTLDYGKYPGDAEERRIARLVELADAAVVVWDEWNPNVRELVSRLHTKGVRLVLLSAREQATEPAGWEHRSYG